MTKQDVYNELETKWGLNDATTLKEIKERYNTITNLNNLTIGQKVDYLYNYVLESMLNDNDITFDLYCEIKDELKNEEAI